MQLRALLCFSCLVLCALACAAYDKQADEALLFEHKIAQALLGNDVARLQQYLAPEWEIISADGSVISRSRFLELLATGVLRHRSISVSGEQSHTYGATVIFSAHTLSVGSYLNADFSTEEISTDVLVKRQARWQLVHTQLTASTTAH
jgi:Domain of unknown function (DUF4440)